MERLTYNEWTFSGEVTYINELDVRNEFTASVKLEGVSSRKGATTKQIVKFTCLLERETYEEAKKKGLDKFKYVTLGGHIETWVKQSDKGDTQRMRFVCDDVLEVC